MGKRSERTTKSQIRSALRNLWLRSRERVAALKRDGYRCQGCGVKQSRAKGKEVYVEVHHVSGVTNWDAIFDAIYEHLLCHPDELQTLCKACHDAKELEEEGGKP